jgi:hypothetical protein
MTRLGFVVTALWAGTGCRDLSNFTTLGDSYEGCVVKGAFVRAGIDPSAALCLTIDANHLQDLPGTISSNDGRFDGAALRPIPQIWHDPLSTLSFGEGRLKNLLYVATPNAPLDGGSGDVFVVVSLMQSGDVEVRLLRGAPNGTSPAGAEANLFAVFDLMRKHGPCSFEQCSP